MSISVALLPFPCVYHPQSDLPLGEHVFPGRKYSALAGRLRDGGYLDDENCLSPNPACREDLLRVHTPAWVKALLDGTITYEEVLRLEIPYSRPLVDICLLHAGGTLLAAEEALSNGCCFHLGGGFHHAFAGHGEGFCAIHDVAVALRTLLDAGKIRSALVVDTDVHQGNGTAAIFAEDRRVFTFSIHQENNYPAVKQQSDLDVGVSDGAGDEEYLALLDAALEQCFSLCQPDLVAYVAGSDPYRQDKLGGLNLSIEGMYERDRKVAAAAFGRRAAIFATLAGGYAVTFDDTLTLHANTALALAAAMTQSPDASLPR
ncbi:MAG: histone deacetylase [Bryobacter sp.]|nr:histone deacetylase [Bryobacter sp.]